MDSVVPVCLSQHFVHKNNVRSYKNIRAKLKSKEIAPFLGQIFEDDLVVSRISSELIEVLLTLRSNIKTASKDDFKNYFASIKTENGRKLQSVNKEDVFNCCWKALNQIISQSFFGGNQNCKVLKKILRAAVFSMKRQHIILSKLLKKWDFNVGPWNSLRGESMNILYKIVMWLVQYLISAMICLNFYVTTCKLDADENKLHFFWKNDWQSFYDRKVSSMIISKVLKRYNPYCLGKKVRKHYSLSERLKRKSIKREIPKLYLVLKANNNFRPIVRYKNEQPTSTEKYKIKERLNFLKTLTTGKPNQKIETQFSNIHKSWFNANRPNLYFVKTDLSNAFGLINKDKLMKILHQRHLDFQKRETNVNLKKKFAQHYKETLGELRKPLLIRAGSTVYEWTEGLVQGYKFSPALSELYYSYLDEMYFPEHLKNSGPGIRFFMRVVDDYLYITDSVEDAYSFLDALSSYRNVNYDKTLVNFDHKSIKSSKEITILGYSYNTETLEVSRAKNVYVGQMCYKIAFSSSISNMCKFMENRIGQSGIHINGHIFNLHHNPESVIWQHIFTTYCLSANKLCTILSVCDLCSDKDEMQMYVTLYKKRVAVKLTNSIIWTLMRNKPADFIFAYCINHFRYLSFKALYLCAKETPKCSGLIPFINAELCKSNCIFGKWQDHGCRIEPNGRIARPAIIEVCRRSDLRSIMNDFDSLPSGFECFNSRNL